MTTNTDKSEVRFDYVNQAWIENGKYVRCGHLDSMDCKCYGKVHEGESAATAPTQRDTPHLHCHVKRAKDVSGAVFLAQELIHPSKWTSHDADALGELKMRRDFRNRNGIFGAFQRRGYWLVTFTPSNLK